MMYDLRSVIRNFRMFNIFKGISLSSKFVVRGEDNIKIDLGELRCKDDAVIIK